MTRNDAAARVVVVGGYGVFGSRIVELLLRDGCEVWAAGRNPAGPTRGTPLALDRDGDLSALAALGPDVVVDATGPFQRTGADRYRLAAHCVANGTGYLDLSDDAAFTAGIVRFDTAARAAGCFALSGASSVPGLSSAVVATLAAGMDEITGIDTAILPGNRAPRGRALVASILAQAGRPMTFLRDGTPHPARSWSRPRRYPVAPGLVRTGYLFDVPDLLLFPAHFRACSVTFRAGLELGLLNRALAAYSFLRARGWLPRDPAALVAAAHRVAALLEPFGTDRGAMQVAVAGTAGATRVERRWTLVAETGEGPFVPAAMVRALVRRRAAVSPGARPCLAEVPLAEAEDAMSDLAVRFMRDPEPDSTGIRIVHELCMGCA